MDVPAQAKRENSLVPAQAKRENSLVLSLFFFFYSGRPSMHQMMPAYTGEGDILYSVDSNVNPFKPNINDTLRSNVLPTM